MKEKLNLVEILKNVQKGTKLWSPICGECELSKVNIYNAFPIVCVGINDGLNWEFRSDGTYTENVSAECVLFPSYDNHDWSTFNVPKKHKEFKHFQKVLIKEWRDGKSIWMADFYSHYDKDICQHYLVGGFVREDDEIIPYEGNENMIGKAEMKIPNECR